MLHLYLILPARIPINSLQCMIDYNIININSYTLRGYPCSLGLIHNSAITIYCGNNYHINFNWLILRINFSSLKISIAMIIMYSR